MNKKWVKLDHGKFIFYVNNTEAGKMEIAYNSLERIATCRIGENDFTIKRTGFWKSSIEISDKNGQPIAKVYTEKWYANSWTMEYLDKKYKLVVRNNPLAEWAILEDSKELTAYGLITENRKVIVRITSPANNADYLFDFLLWYLFVPMASENMGDNFTFSMLLNP